MTIRFILNTVWCCLPIKEVSLSLGVAYKFPDKPASLPFMWKSILDSRARLCLTLAANVLNISRTKCKAIACCNTYVMMIVLANVKILSNRALIRITNKRLSQTYYLSYAPLQNNPHENSTKTLPDIPILKEMWVFSVVKNILFKNLAKHKNLYNKGIIYRQSLKMHIGLR